MNTSILQRPSTGLPSGVVTFLFTDIEGSTRLIQDHGESAHDALARHQAILQRTIDAHHSRVFNIVGDAFCCAFADPGDAVAAALAAQQARGHLLFHLSRSSPYGADLAEMLARCAAELRRVRRCLR